MSIICFLPSLPQLTAEHVKPKNNFLCFAQPKKSLLLFTLSAAGKRQKFTHECQLLVIAENGVMASA